MADFEFILITTKCIHLGLAESKNFVIMMMKMKCRISPLIMFGSYIHAVYQYIKYVASPSTLYNYKY